jgi:hypothetical protein
MEKFLLRSNTSQRQLISKISSKLVNNELIFLEKFKKPKKLVIPEFKTSIILNQEKPQAPQTPEMIKELKFKRSTKESVSNSPKISPRYTVPGTPTTIFTNQTPSEKILSKYNQLFTSTSESPNARKKFLRKAKNKVKTLCKNIKEIGKQNMSKKKQEEFSVKMFDKYHEKKYLKQALKEMKSKKINESVLEARHFRYSLNSLKSAR